MARTLYDTAQNASTPPAGHYADLESKAEQLGALVNEHAVALDKLATPGGVGAAKGTIAAPVADGDTAGALEVIYTFQPADAATADYDITVDSKCEVVAIGGFKTGANGAAVNTAQVKRVTGGVASAISDAMSININQDVPFTAGLRTQANATLLAGDKLRLSIVKAGGNAACEVIVKTLKRT